ncbi:hypothetical protein Tco_1137567 [Tanacetum coccineum]
MEVASKKGKEKLEHFGVKLEEEKEYHGRKDFHPMQPNRGPIQNNDIKIKEEETSSTSSEDLVIVWGTSKEQRLKLLEAYELRGGNALCNILLKPCTICSMGQKPKTDPYS